MKGQEKKQQEKESSIFVARCDLFLLPLDNTDGVPVGMQVSVNRRVSDTYRNLYGEKWDILFNMYMEQMREVSNTFVEGMTILSRLKPED